MITRGKIKNFFCTVEHYFLQTSFLPLRKKTHKREPSDSPHKPTDGFFSLDFRVKTECDVHHTHPEDRLCELSVFLHYAALFDTSLLAGEGAEVVELCAAHFAVLVHDDRVDERRLYGENTLHTDVVAHLAHSEALLAAFTIDADNHAAVLLDTLFVTLFDAVSHGDGVAGTELRELLAGGESLFGNFD